MNYSDILRWVKTTDHARDLLSEIEILIENLFKMETNAFENALKSISILTSQTLREAFTKNGISLGDKSSTVSVLDKTMIKVYLTGLREQLQKLKVLKLFLAFEASVYSIDYIFAWILKNQRFGVILDIKTDKSIIGGAIIEFEGKYKDYSLKKNLGEVFASRREEIMKPLQD